jgi:hypothetical protein
MMGSSNFMMGTPFVTPDKGIAGIYGRRQMSLMTDPKTGKIYSHSGYRKGQNPQGIMQEFGFANPEKAGELLGVDRNAIQGLRTLMEKKFGKDINKISLKESEDFLRKSGIDFVNHPQNLEKSYQFLPGILKAGESDLVYEKGGYLANAKNGGQLMRYKNGGYLDLSAPEKKKFNAAAKAMGHTRKQHAAHTFEIGGYLPMYQLGGGISIPSSYVPGTTAPGPTAAPAITGAGAGTPQFNTGAGGGVNQLSQIQGGDIGEASGGGGQVTFDPPLMIPLNSGQIGEMEGGEAPAESVGAPQNPARGAEENANNLGAGIAGMAGQFFADGGQLPQYALGSWLGAAGGIASAIPVVGTIAGPILKTAGKIAEKKEAEAAAKEEARRNSLQAQFEFDQQAKGVQDQFALPEAQYEYGGGLMEGNFKNPVIVNYKNGQTHDGPQGGIPVDSLGNPSSVSKRSAVGLTKKGEVTWNGYVFSDDLT